MKAKLSMAFADLRGKDGSVVIRKSRSGLVATPRTTPKNPRSNGQVGSRNALSKGSKGFANFTASQAAAWNAYGATITKHNKVSGTTYTSTGISAYNALATKFLQINPGGTVPVAPPTTAFLGDGIAISTTAGTGQVTFTASAANAAGVKTELLVQPLKGKNRKPGARGYVSKGFVAFAAGALSSTVTVPSGYYACAFRFVSTTTGQATALTPLATVTVALSLEDGGMAEGESVEQKAA